jgi:hypothetical protein
LAAAAVAIAATAAPAAIHFSIVISPAPALTE